MAQQMTAWSRAAENIIIVFEEGEERFKTTIPDWKITWKLIKHSRKPVNMESSWNGKIIKKTFNEKKQT
jgi:hypothetical protein